MKIEFSISHFENAPILVTGGCGFIGSHLVEALDAQGARITVVDNLQAGRWDNLRAASAGVRQVEGDVRDAAAMRHLVDEVSPLYVFHLAANASVPGSVQDPAYDFETNCSGTFALLDALRHSAQRNGACRKVVIASSGAVYGEPTSFPIREEDAVRPISPYGASKANSEITGRMFGDVYGLPVVMARLFNCYGPRMARFVILDFLRKLEQNPRELQVLGTGQQVRDFTYVSDTVQALLLLAQSGVQDEAYNISSGTSCSVSELAQMLLGTLELEEQTQIVYTGQSWVGDAQRWEVAIDKMRALGYDPQVSLGMGLQKTVEWFQSQLRADVEN